LPVSTTEMLFSQLATYLKICIKEQKFPGCVCLIADHKDMLFFEWYGYAQITPTKITMTTDTMFDLASLTKPIATALSIMLLYEEGKLTLDDRLDTFLNDFKNRPNGRITIKELLTHTSGIPAWFPTYLLNKEEQMEFLATANTGSNNVIYSCLGYIILGAIIESIIGYRFDRYCNEHIFRKIGLEKTCFGPLESAEKIAATELGNEHEKEMAQKHGDISHIQWRDYLIKGQVHDGNSFYSHSGIAGNAGLFSHAADLLKIMRAYMSGEIVNGETVKMMIHDYTGGEQQRGLGWLVNPYPGLLSVRAYGHTGFTGTMLIVDPEKPIITILLTNAVHPKVKLGVMPEVRRRVVEIIHKILITKF
jgi:CubicO group peptidase (beta-lactamase class C family)